MMNRLEFF